MKKHLYTFLFLTIKCFFCFAQDPTLWGLTVNGGTNNLGAIFNYDIKSNKETNVYDFRCCSDGQLPYGSLFRANNGLLYGTTFYGGNFHQGTIFSYDLRKDTEIILQNFGPGGGTNPLGNLIQANNGLLYGFTSSGGAHDAGIIFSVDVTTGQEMRVYNFEDNGNRDGICPVGSFIQASDGLLYGLTNHGGQNNFGTIYSFNILTGAETDLHDFDSTDGQWPWGSLFQASNGLLYGITFSGGAHQSGVIFNYNISTGIETDIHDFGNGSDGQNSESTLIQANNGLLFGMTQFGGIYGNGIIFSYDFNTETYSDLYDFGPDTAFGNPSGSLLQASNGLLYGLTSSGGNTGKGDIFSYDILTHLKTDLHEFGFDSDGAESDGDLIEIDSPLTTGVNSFASATNGIYLYPNPSSSQITIRYAPITINTTLEILNYLGEEVSNYLVSAGSLSTKVDVSEFSSGLYFCKMQTGDKVEVLKFIKE